MRVIRAPALPVSSNGEDFPSRVTMKSSSSGHWVVTSLLSESLIVFTRMMLVMIPKVIWIIMGWCSRKKGSSKTLSHMEISSSCLLTLCQVHGEGHESDWNHHRECGKVPGLLISSGVRYHQQMLRIEDHFLLSQVSFCYPFPHQAIH